MVRSWSVPPVSGNKEMGSDVTSSFLGKYKYDVAFPQLFDK